MKLNTYQIISIAQARLAGDSNLIEKWGYVPTAEEEALIKLAIKLLKEK